MDLNVNIATKTMDTAPIKNLFAQGESLADDITIKLPLAYGDVDLTALNFLMRGASKDAETTATQTLAKTVGLSGVDLAWPVSNLFTATPGALDLVLVATDDAGNTIVKFCSDTIYVRGDKTQTGLTTITPDAHEAIVAQIYALLAALQVVKILGVKATYELLVEEVTDPAIGDIYAVGASAPYEGYLWVGSWVNLGPLRGQQGDPGEDGVDGVMTGNEISTNLLINGGFDVWQRGTTATNPTDYTYLADHWAMRRYNGVGTAPSNCVISRQLLASGAIPNAFYHFRYTADGAGTNGPNSVYGVIQNVEHGTRNFCGTGKTVTISFWARSDVAGRKLGVGMRQYYGSGGSPSAFETIQGETFTLTTSWAKYTHTFTTNTLAGKTFGTANDDYIRIYMVMSCGSDMDAYIASGTGFDFVGSGYTDIATVQLNYGSVALPFVPMPIEIERLRCYRYYLSVVGQFNGYAYATTAKIKIPTSVQMRANPTATVSGELMLINTIASFTTVTAEASENSVDLSITLGSSSGAAVANLNATVTLDAEL